MIARLAVVACGAASIVTACSSSPTMQDQMPSLAANQGVAALAFHQAYGVSELILLSKSSRDQTLYVSSIADGDSVVLIPADAGRYCFHQYHIGGHFFTAEHDDQCFEVQPGKVSYGGMYEPYQTVTMNPGPETQKTKGMVPMDDFHGFLRLLRRNYPHIAAQSFSTIEDVPPQGICSLLGQQLATKLLGAPVDAGIEISTTNAPECVFSDSRGHEVKYSFLLGNDPEKQFDSLTSGEMANGWSSWSAPRNYGLPLGRKLEMSKKPDALKMAVLLRDRVFTLTVSGGDAGMLQEPMISAARSIVAGCQVAEMTFQSCVYQAH